MSLQRAKEIFLDAIDLPEVERDAFVTRACGDDAALRVHVEELLRQHFSSRGKLDRPAASLDRTWFSQPVTSSTSERPGDVIGRYRLVRALGEGGFGTVFLAEQTEPVVRQVALKVIKQGMDTQQVIARFENERQALAMMDHPGIARVLDAGASESGRPYFVMEYVEGKPITAFCAADQLGITERLELIEQACLAVQHAHQKGIIHRDLKPGNVLVTVVDGRPVVKVIDFGVAKAIDPSVAGVALTLEMQIVGTPQYMSPEQATTGSAHIDTRTDVYSLGTVLYELITGAPPFDPQALRHAGLERLCQIIREETPPRPSTRVSTITDGMTPGIATRQLRRQLSGEIDWIVMKALEKEPSRRYQSPAELGEDIRLHLSHQVIRAGPPSRLYQFRKFARRHRLALGATALIAISLITTAIVASVLAARARRAENEAKLQFQRAQTELSRANAIVDFTDDLLSGITPAVARGRDTALLHELLNRSIIKARTDFGGQTRIALAVNNIIGKALNDLGDPGAALKELTALHQSTKDGPERDHPERIRMGVLITDIYIMQYDAELAEPVIREVEESLKRAHLEDSELGYEAKMARAGVLMRSNRAGDAEPIFRSVFDHYASIGKGESGLALRAGNDLASVFATLGRLQESSDLWQRMYEIERRVQGEDHPATLMTMMDIGLSLQHQAKLPEAERWMRDALVTARRIFEPGHATLLTNLHNLASLLMYESRLPEAETLFVEAYETGKKKLALTDTPLDVIVLSLSRALSRQGRPEEAIPLMKQLLQAVTEKYGPRNRRTISLLSYFFEDCAAVARPEEGLRLVREMGEIPEDTNPEIRQRLLAAIGKLHLAAGDRDQARRYAQLARDISPQARGPLILRELETALAVNTTRPATQP